MSLAHGGHLTHGHAVSLSGQLWRAVQYGVRAEDGRIDYDQLEALAREHRPRIIVAGASAYPRIIEFPRFAAIAREVGAALVVDMAHIAGLVAAELHPSPVPHADLVTSTTHKTLRGPRGGFVLAKAEHGERLDKTVFPGMQGGPLMHVIAAKAGVLRRGADARVPRLPAPGRRERARARRGAHGSRLPAGVGRHGQPSDARRPEERGMTGKVAEEALHRAHITVNKNAVPNDPQKPWVTSGIRIGTPALTTRGLGPAEMARIGGWIARVLAKPDDAAESGRVAREVLELCSGFPLFAEAKVAR
jgi:glycine hydroxymethyltransferase